MVKSTLHFLLVPAASVATALTLAVSSWPAVSILSRSASVHHRVMTMSVGVLGVKRRIGEHLVSIARSNNSNAC